MAIRRLFNILSEFGAGNNPLIVRNDSSVGRGPVLDGSASNQIRQARVVAVGLTTIVELEGRIERVSQATDEPLRAGQKVWVLTARGGGVVVVGSVR